MPAFSVSKNVFSVIFTKTVILTILIYCFRVKILRLCNYLSG